ncbi:unnamed protein product [Sphenostylis stenocarpa]|uniref:Uncharacterized protein n=1 Tax=Sphenostylis stenocarpa TaxID=92480 RepID=A0AA86W4N2_9FABA|nr:unnamed protein product [Sphenostylis stenocarpa]
MSLKKVDAEGRESKAGMRSISTNRDMNLRHCKNCKIIYMEQEMENIESQTSYRAAVQEEAPGLFGKRNSSVTLKVLSILKGLPQCMD